MNFFYESCDLIMNISKQTVAIVNEVDKKKPRTDWDCTYVPHGINERFLSNSRRKTIDRNEQI